MTLDTSDSRTSAEMAVAQNKTLSPRVKLSPAALDQLRSLVENDFTLAGKYFRLVISGKNRDGFTYSASFTDMQPEDYLVALSNSTIELKNIYGGELKVLLDPFTAFYLQESTVEYWQDLEQNREGFRVINHQQKEATN